MTARRTLKLMNKARDFPDGTCPATRHAAMIAEELILRGAHPMLEEAPAHCGESIAATVRSAWSARRKLKEMGYTWTTDDKGRMVWERK